MNCRVGLLHIYLYLYA